MPSPTRTGRPRWTTGVMGVPGMHRRGCSSQPRCATDEAGLGGGQCPAEWWALRV